MFLQSSLLKAGPLHTENNDVDYYNEVEQYNDVEQYSEVEHHNEVEQYKPDKGTSNDEAAFREFGRQLAGAWGLIGSGGTYSVPRMENGRVTIGIPYRDKCIYMGPEL